MAHQEIFIDPYTCDTFGGEMYFLKKKDGNKKGLTGTYKKLVGPTNQLVAVSK